MAGERVCIYRIDLRFQASDRPVAAERHLLADSPGDLGQKYGRIAEDEIVAYEFADVEDGQLGRFRPWTDVERAAFQAGVEQHRG
jgi:hypothetical protein